MTFDVSPFNHGYKQVEKRWGREIWLVNSPDYCAKLLIVEPGFACSLHRHPIKSETYFIFEGNLAVEWGTDPSYLHLEVKAPGDCLRLISDTYHRFWCHDDHRVVFLEVSTTHADDDVERLQESRAL